VKKHSSQHDKHKSVTISRQTLFFQQAVATAEAWALIFTVGTSSQCCDCDAALKILTSSSGSSVFVQGHRRMFPNQRLWSNAMLLVAQKVTLVLTKIHKKLPMRVILVRDLAVFVVPSHFATELATCVDCCF